MHPSVAFDDVARALSSGGSGVHPSEAHGCLCGAFCARREYSFAEWIDEILPGAQPEGQHALRDLFDDSVGVLARAGMEF